jgi:hypothetical protein
MFELHLVTKRRTYQQIAHKTSTLEIDLDLKDLYLSVTESCR